MRSKFLSFRYQISRSCQDQHERVMSRVSNVSTLTLLSVIPTMALPCCPPPKPDSRHNFSCFPLHSCTPPSLVTRPQNQTAVITITLDLLTPITHTEGQITLVDVQWRNRSPVLMAQGAVSLASHEVGS